MAVTTVGRAATPNTLKGTTVQIEPAGTAASPREFDLHSIKPGRSNFNDWVEKSLEPMGYLSRFLYMGKKIDRIRIQRQR
jgi:hypothetical protein